MTAAPFRAESLRFTYPGARDPAVDDVSLVVEAGTVYSVLGPNGSGKSTLLRLLLGWLRPDTGAVRYTGREVHVWERRALARHIGVVPQSEEIPFPLTVRQLVDMGRYPHLGPWRGQGPADDRAVEDALAMCDLAGLADRPVSTLSGGERQRARVARALTQEPETLVLDEPTASLDIRHEMAIFRLLRRLAAERRVTVLLVTHNINLAARYSGRVLLLDRGRTAAEGTVDEVFRHDVIEAVYRWPVALTRHPGPGADAGAPQVVPLGGETEA